MLVTFKFVVAELPLVRLTLELAKVQVAFAGHPELARFTVPAKPLREVTVTV